MIDLVIRGIELPKDGKISISITANGNAYLGIEPACSQKKFETVVLPEPHGKLMDIREVRDKMIKYGFTASDMTVTEFVEDELTAVLEASEAERRERMKAILTGHQPRQLANNPIPPNVAPAYMPNSEVKE